jgi:hypothetical protein
MKMQNQYLVDQLRNLSSGMLKPKNSNLHRNEMKDFRGKTQNGAVCGGKNRWML